MKQRLVLLAGMSLLVPCLAAPVVIHNSPVFLRSGAAPEWDDFAGRQPAGSRFEVEFVATANRAEATLFVRQDDVRQDWNLELNGRRIGKLFLMEADLVHTIPVPPGALRDGTNRLVIVPPRDNDDIVLHEITLNERPPFEATAEGVMAVRVTGAADGSALPCRLTITDEHGALAALVQMTNTAPGATRALAVRPGVAYTGDGAARLGLRAGRYTVWASRGFEYGLATQAVTVVKGASLEIALALRREVSTPGLVSCDTHIHTFTHSRHGDCTLDERMLTLAGEGIELPISTDHNLHISYAAPAEKTGVRQFFTPVTGNEVTTPAGHFNIFPVAENARVPDHRITDWPRLMEQLRGTPEVRVVVLNHPRNFHNGFQPFAATNFNAVSGENKRGPEFTFDAMEVLNSSAQQSDYMLVYRDWFALLNHGYRITAVGSSDSHDVSRYIMGQGRTYIACPDSDVAKLDVPSACSNLLAGRALVSMGLLVQLTVQERFTTGDLATNLGSDISMEARVLGPSWSRAGRVELFANGATIRAEEIDERAGSRAGLKAAIQWKLPRPAHDVHLVAIATGPAVTAPFWAIPRPYQPASPRWTGRVIASTNPVWLDADGDGRFSSARDYARRLVTEHGLAPEKIIPALNRFDEAVAAQTASLCAAGGADIGSADFAQALRGAAPQVQRGFSSYAAQRWQREELSFP